MLAKRIIPCLDVDRGRVVKGVNFIDLIDAGDPVELPAFYEREESDELVFLDITASHEERETVYDMLRRTASEVFIPFTVGGGLRTLEDMRRILLNGADKVSVNTAAVQNPELITQGAREFGSQCIVVAVDAKSRAPRGGGEGAGNDAGPWEVYLHGGRTPTGIDAIGWIREAEDRGAGEILLTSMDADGTKEGYDLEVTRAASRAVGIPIIASGGAGTLEHLRGALVEGEADAALAASIFHFGTYSIREAKEFLRARGVCMRL